MPQIEMHPQHATFIPPNTLMYTVCNHGDTDKEFWLCENPYDPNGPDKKAWKKRKIQRVFLKAKECQTFVYKVNGKPTRTYTDFHSSSESAERGPSDRFDGYAAKIEVKEEEEGEKKEKSLVEIPPGALGRFIGGASFPVGPTFVTIGGRSREMLYTFPTPYPMRLLNFWGPRPCRFVIEGVEGLPIGWQYELVSPRLMEPFVIEPGDLATMAALRIRWPSSAKSGQSVYFRTRQRVAGVVSSDSVYTFDVHEFLLTVSNSSLEPTYFESIESHLKSPVLMEGSSLAISPYGDSGGHPGVAVMPVGPSRVGGVDLDPLKPASFGQGSVSSPGQSGVAKGGECTGCARNT